MVYFEAHKKVIKGIAYSIIAFSLSFAFCINNLQNAYANDVERTSRNDRQLLQEEKELLRGRTFTVAYNKDHKPFQYTDEDGQAMGTVISMLDNLAEYYGFYVDYVPYTAKEAELGKYDIVAATVARLLDLEKNYSPTIEFHEERLMLIFKKDYSLQEIRTKKHQIALVDYAIEVEQLEQEFPEAKFRYYQTSNELLHDYDNNEISAALFSRTLLDASMLGKMAFIREYYNKDNTIRASNVIVPQKLYISKSIAKQFLPIFNAMLLEIDYVSSLLYDAEAHLEELPFSAPTYYATDIIILVIIAVCVLILVFYLVKIFRKRSSANRAHQVHYTKSALQPFNVFSNEVEKKLHIIKPGKYELIGIDIDLFKLITAYYGHEIAETLIDKMSTSLIKAFANDDALITRYNTDYFLIFKQINDEGISIQTFVEEILTPRFKEITGQHYAVSFSVGTYIVKDTNVSLSDMITFSELARRQGKSIHTSTFYTFDDVMSKQYHDKLNITYRMTSALENKEFFVEFQPKIDLIKLKVTGAEALVRWQPKNEAKIYPIDFIPVFEKNGFIPNLDVYVFEEVCKFIQKNRKLSSGIKIACNLSPVTIAKDTIVEELLQIARKYTVDPSKIELEIVESVIDDMPLPDLVSRINLLKQHGFSIALDDFGAGASSLNRFGLLPIDVVKFDKKFIDNIENERMAHTVKHFIANSKELKLITVAEGVETKEQLNWLKEAQCDIVQGYLLAKPQPKEEFIETLKADFLYLQ